MAGVEIITVTGVDGSKLPEAKDNSINFTPEINPTAVARDADSFRFYDYDGSGSKLDPFSSLDQQDDTREYTAEDYGQGDVQLTKKDSRDYEVGSELHKRVLNSPKLLSYPSDLNAVNGDTELVHSVVFRIMARSNSRVAQIRADAGFKDQVGDISEENRVTGENGQAYLQALGTLASSALVYKNIIKTGSPTGKAVKGLAAFVGLGVANKSLSEVDLIDNVTTVNIDTAIELYLTQPPIAQYSANWENKELGALGGNLALGGSSTLSNLGFLQGAAGVAELGVRGVIGAAASLPAAVGLTGDLAAGIEATTRKVANPYKEQLFKSMGFRQFAFSYKFVPRNQSELDTVMNIIQQFKYHMHPENDPTGLFLEYPSEFEIEYHYKGQENNFLSKISTCALTDVKVTYGGQDAFTSFIDTRGAPSEIQMDLAFQELETLTNDRIGLNYKDSL